MVSTLTGRNTTTTRNGKVSRGMAKGVTEDKARMASLERALSQSESSFGKGAIMRLDEEASNLIPAISTGARSRDLALGGRGLARAELCRGRGRAARLRGRRDAAQAGAT